MSENLPLAYTLIVVGLLLLVADLILYTVVLSVLSACALLIGLTMVFANDPSTGLVTALAVFVAIPVLFTLVTRLAPRTRWGRRLFLSQPHDDETIASMPTLIELEQLRGRYGKAISSLRPAGVVEFDGKRVDTLSEGALIEPGQWVRCVDVKSGRVLVRAVAKPPDLADFDTETT